MPTSRNRYLPMDSSGRTLLGNTGLSVPRMVYGTSHLGNLYSAKPWALKRDLMGSWFECTGKPVVIDTAGKYGAGLALETIGRGLAELGIDPGDIIISNKLGWYRVPLVTGEPTFEPGVWAGLEHDAVQRFGYRGIMDCYAQGELLLGATYGTDLVSLHDPDEYLLGAAGKKERGKRLALVLESYRALFDLKEEGRVLGVGIGSKDWTVIRELYDHVPFDWVMLANSFTIYSHPGELMQFMERLRVNGVGIINSALFHGGFLTGGDHFDYRKVDPASPEGRRIHRWRDAFREVCRIHAVAPDEACLQFGLSHPAIAAVALNTSRPEQMKRNAEAVGKVLPPRFWSSLKEEGLIDPYFPYL